MSWVKLDDRYDLNDKVIAAGPDAELLNVRAFLHASRNRTDGHVRASSLEVVGRGLTTRRRKEAIRRLVAERLWHEPGHTCDTCPQIQDGYYIHDYLDYQPSAAKKSQERAEARDRMARARANKTNGSRNVRANTERSSEGVRITPSRPEPELQQQRSEVRDHQAEPPDPPAAAADQPEPRPLAGLISLGLTRTDALELIETHGPDAVTTQLENLRRRGNIRDPARWIRKALANSYELANGEPRAELPATTSPDEIDRWAAEATPPPPELREIRERIRREGSG